MAKITSIEIRDPDPLRGLAYASPAYFIGCDPAREADTTVICEFRDGKFVRFVPEEEWSADGVVES